MFARLLVHAAVGHVAPTTFLSFVPTNLTSPKQHEKIRRVLRAHRRALFPMHERDGNVWCVLAFSSPSDGASATVCEIHHWYMHKSTAVQRLAALISKHLDVSSVHCLAYDFHVQLPHILPLFLFVREGFGSVWM